MQYRYRAYTLQRGLIEGKLDAKSEAEAKAQIELQGYKPLQVAPARRLPDLEELFPSLFRVRTAELVQFVRDLATLLNSGSVLLRALEVLQSRSRSRKMRRTVESIRATLDEGGSLSTALAQHPQVFSPLFVSVVQVGEATGRLGRALDQLADMLAREHEVRQKAIRTMMYPLAIMGLSMATLALLMTLALPSLLEVFGQMDAELPLITRIAISAAEGVRSYFVFVLGGVAATAGLLAFLQRFPRFRLRLHALQIRLPLIGPFIVTGELARFSRAVSMLLEAGIPLANALELTVGGCKNLLIRGAFRDAEESLLSGHGFSDALRRHNAVPAMYSELLMVGEESNSLQRVMDDAAATYQRQLEQRLGALLGALEPASTLAVGGVVAFIAFSMFAPIYSGLNVIGG